MQLSFEFESSNDLCLPLHYNHLIQGFLYESIDPDLSRFLHDKGYEVDNRPFRLFVYSRILGNYRIISSEEKIFFTPKIKLLIASPCDKFCLSLAKNIIRRGDLHLGNNILHSVTYTTHSSCVNNESIVVCTQSPITVYSTLFRPDQRKYTVYFQPGDPDYNRLITENLQRKYRAFYKKQPPSGDVSVRSHSRLKRSIVKYKGFIIKGYSGNLSLNGPPELLQIALDAGLGAKNSQGFGFIQMC
jgi:CRISPR-associated endoribonuclease Cas6